MSGDVESLARLKGKARQSFKSDVNWFFAADLLATSYERAKDYENASKMYKRILDEQSDPNSRLQAMVSYAKSEAKLGRIDEAISLLVGEINKTQDDQELANLYYTLYEIYGATKMGLAALEKAIDLKPTDTGLRFTAGFHNKESLLSIFHYSTSLDFSPNEPSTLNVSSRIMVNQLPT